MTTRHDFEPDWCSPPGETVADILDQSKLSPEEFAQRMGMTTEEVHDVFDGRAALTSEMAEQLSRTLGSTATFWMTREQQYRADLDRLAKSAPAGSDREWLRELPIADMIRFGWIPKVSSTSEKIAACLRFFDVTNANEWRDRGEVSAVFRTSAAVESRPGAVAAWLRQGEIAASDLICGPWNRERFRAVLPTLRPLTRKRHPANFIPQLKEECAECGVAIAVVRAPKGCRASGATRFPTPQKPLLLLSFRHLSDDQFWFTFFHEAGHLVLHGEQSLFLEGKTTPLTDEEHEANDFAARLLIPSEFEPTMLALPPHAIPVIRFAHRVGISPGIVVGQLQHRGRFRQDQLNHLKRRFVWE